MKGRTALPWIVPEYCEGCTSCVAACKRGCLAMFATRDEDVFVPWMADPALCTGCGRCSEVCVLGGISMTAYQDEAAMRFKSKLEDGTVRLLHA